ncbi:outer membrane beta-barrel protein [Bradyrhizobium sp. WSM 1704]|uniref:outer membrane protein n=1 Tax=Bradyrhizobium semiaridum TaxID=2821404 RepID=UPI001CE2FDF7|nr:outer membrane beta-barrel protein [Bradyrhizobium semiaridum]MCA6120455.1 outer membrane beta-barrel protein [Bradyrhizobium semiaridum]
MKKFLLSTVALLAFAAPAAAADLAARPYTKAPAPVLAPVYDWTGFYIGVNGGWGSSHNCWNQTPGSVFIGSDGCHDATGGTAGGQIGYRWQAGTWVFGLEAQGNWADFKGSNSAALFPGIFTNQTKIDAFGLFTGQIGYAVNNVLLYVKGGAALTDNRYRTYFAPTGVLAGSADDTRWGGSVGAGIEVGFAPNWTAGIEYNHLFMEDHDYTLRTPAGALFSTIRERQDVDLVTVRVNYKWGGPVVAKY